MCGPASAKRRERLIYLPRHSRSRHCPHAACPYAVRPQTRAQFSALTDKPLTAQYARVLFYPPKWLESQLSKQIKNANIFMGARGFIGIIRESAG